MSGGAVPPSGRRRTLFWLAVVLAGLLLVSLLRGLLAPQLPRFVPPPGVASGCGRGAVPAGSTAYAMTSGGVTRSYLLHVPRGYDGRRAVPLVLNFHGFSMSGALEERYSAMSALADRDGFVVVYPDGTPAPRPLSWLTGIRVLGWNDGYNGAHVPGDDLRFTDDLIGLLTRQLCLGPRRVYATGLSNGGGMADHLACSGDRRIAAIATVAGAFHVLPGGCHPARPLAVLAIQGTADPVVPFGGYRSGAQVVPSTAEWAAAWARRDACTVRDTPRHVAPDVMQMHYGDCRSSTEVLVDLVLGGGHTWPGARDRVVALGRTATDFDATRAIWDFFSRHHL